MLRGTIDIQSEVEKGTEVTVRLPLTRLPGAATPVSTPSSTTTDGSADESINALRTDHKDTSVALIGFKAHDQSSVLTSCIEDWLGLKIVSPLSHEPATNVCLVDEKELLHLSRHGQSTVPTVVLCDNATRTHTASLHNTRNVIEYVSKPVGPHKLAKALRSCLDKASNFKSGLAPIIAFSDEESPMESEADTVVPHLKMENLTLESEQGLKPFEVQTNGVVTASESENAQMAIDTSSSPSGDVTVTENEAFPFPAQDDLDDQRKAGGDQPPSNWKKHETAQYRGELTRGDSRRPPLVSRMTEPIAKTSFPHSSSILSQYNEATTFPLKPPNQPQLSQNGGSQANGNINSVTVSNMALHNGEKPTQESPSTPAEREKRPPRLLLVDDNKINLRLLETYMRKRKYQFIDSAENGQLAVQAAEAHELGYDIIFMGMHLLPMTRQRSDHMQ